MRRTRWSNVQESNSERYKGETIKIDQALESRYSNRELKNDFQEWRETRTTCQPANVSSYTSYCNIRGRKGQIRSIPSIKNLTPR